MRYALLIYGAEDQDPPKNSAEWREMGRGYAAFGEKWQSHIRGGDELHPSSTATTVRVQNGETLTTDGPFAETKEHLGGFYIVEASDLDEAIAIARDIPRAKNGSIEVRPVVEYG